MGLYGNDLFEYMNDSIQESKEELKTDLSELNKKIKELISDIPSEYRSCFKLKSVSKVDDWTPIVSEDMSKYSTPESEKDGSAKAYYKVSRGFGKSLRSECKKFGFKLSYDFETKTPSAKWAYSIKKK